MSSPGSVLRSERRQNGREVEGPLRRFQGLGLSAGIGVYRRQIGRRTSSRWLYPDLVIDGTANALFAFEVSFCGLNGHVPEQKLDLF